MSILMILRHKGLPDIFVSSPIIHFVCYFSSFCSLLLVFVCYSHQLRRSATDRDQLCQYTISIRF